MTAALALLPETEVIENKAVEVVEKANSIVICDDLTYTAAGELLKAVKAIAAEIKETFRPGIQKAHDLHKTLLNSEKTHLNPVQMAEEIIKRKIAVYMDEQERKRREEQRRIEEEMRKQAEERMLAEAIEMELSGQKEEAEMILNEPVTPPPAILPPATPKVSGISTRIAWKYRINDVNKIPREFMIPNEVKIGQVVRALRDATNIPGIQVYPETSIAAGR